MIQKPALNELIDAARNLDLTEQVALAAAIRDQLGKRKGEGAGLSAGGSLATTDDWMSLAVESLSRAYGHSEPEYSAEDLVP